MLGIDTKPSTPPNRPDIRVGDDHYIDALADLRHQARVLTLAITGYITTPDDVRGDTAARANPFKPDPDADWGHDIENLAIRMTAHLESILAAVEAGEKS